MTRKELFLLCSHMTSVMMLVYKQPIAKEVWSGHCTKQSMVLNDCNWCKCDKTHKYTCKARACNEVDKFGHFNDAIREIDVGMDGHGAWRSTETSCEPGVKYQRDNLLCICGEDGYWPNPVCRDTFQILHSVEFTHEKQPQNQECLPGKLHLFGCNVCFCPSNGRINSEMCTIKDCDNNELDLKVNLESKEIVDEIYAECLIDTKYKLGCKSCICLRNNRLICDNCTTTNSNNSLCSNREVGKIFNVDCNLCYCNAIGLIYCTVKKCLSGLHTKVLATRLTLPDVKFKMAEKPYLDKDCVSGTMYKKDCNTCYCFSNSGMKIFGCTLNKCPGSNDNDIRSDCTEGTVYEMDCLICHCEVYDGVKRQFCQVDHRCTGDQANREPRSRSLRSLHGYCEPLHEYENDCNKCTCAEDGKTVTCTCIICVVKKNPISVDVVPVIQKIGSCPKGHSYAIDCNTCFCLSNGNAICSTASCKNL